MLEKYDAIFIGSGLGSLVCAAYMAKAGVKVAILEKHTITGGFATSFRRKKWEFDVSLHAMSDCAEGGQLHDVLQELGIYDRLRLEKTEILYRCVYPNGSFSAGSNYQQMLRELIEQHHEDANGLKALINEFIKLNDELRSMRRGLPVNSTIFRKYKNYTLKQMLDEFIQSPQLQMKISALWGYFGSPPDELSAIYFVNGWVEYHLYGGYYPTDRSQSISNLLRDLIISNGGHILNRRKVNKIITEDGVAIGVVTDKGEEFKGHYIVSNADLQQTFRDMVGFDKLPVDYAEKIRKVEPSCSTVQAYLILNGDLRHDYGEEAHEIFIHETNDYKTLADDLLHTREERLPFCVTYYENIIKGYRDQGKSTVSIFTLSNYDDWCDLDEREYETKKEESLKSLINRMDHYYPGVKQKIEYAELATPMTVERYTGHYKGAIYGSAKTVDQLLENGVNQVTPIKNLFLVGGWTRNGHGYSGVMVGGARLANMLLLRRRRQRIKGEGQTIC
ncbi:phytoene desaturase family protein [Cohnella endophytica]|uniref:phytoene desaturase family protein n=1 Tax=Cohnella endophytica TaxID=2419778 RepID=UPI001314C3D6|nr:NAD(P)/FAD-dependent oxidoreductase [Cohnella endophytica]